MLVSQATKNPFIGTYAGQAECGGPPYPRVYVSMRLGEPVGNPNGYASLGTARAAAKRITAPEEVGAVAVLQGSDGRAHLREVLGRQYDSWQHPLTGKEPLVRVNPELNDELGGDSEFILRDGYGVRQGVRQVIDGRWFDFTYPAPSA